MNKHCSFLLELHLVIWFDSTLIGCKCVKLYHTENCWNRCKVQPSCQMMDFLLDDWFYCVMKMVINSPFGTCLLFYLILLLLAQPDISVHIWKILSAFALPQFCRVLWNHQSHLFFLSKTISLCWLYCTVWVWLIDGFLIWSSHWTVDSMHADKMMFHSGRNWV